MIDGEPAGEHSGEIEAALKHHCPRRRDGTVKSRPRHTRTNNLSPGQ